MSTRACIAAVCQANRFFPSPEANRQHVLDLLKPALRRNPDLVCLPENAYPWLRLGEPAPPQSAAHGDRLMYSKQSSEAIP